MNPAIPKNRLLLYILLAGFLPIVIAFFYYLNAQSTLNHVHAQLEHVQQLAAARERKQSVNIAIRNHFHEADHFYIDKNLETLTFLEPEIESLQKVKENKNFAGDENIKQRLEKLTGDGNRLVFTEGSVQSHPFFQEVTETVIRPVEVNAEDIRHLLTKIEGIEIAPYVPGPNRPQLIILDFKLEKKVTDEKNEVFLLNLKLLKREFL